MNRSNLLAIVAVICGVFAGKARAEDITIRISWKIILDANGNPPTGRWTQMATWDEAVVLGNAGHDRFGRGFRYQHQFDGNVSGASQFFELLEGQGCALETAARNNPGQYHWRNVAMNVYIVNHSGGTAADPKCHGFAHSADGDCGGGYNPGMVVMCSGAMAGVGMCHEWGHFFGLRHTWGDDLVADTPVDTDPNQCPSNDPGTPNHNENCDLGGTRECCCQTQIDLTLQRAQQDGWSAATTAVMVDNLMSYHCRINDYYTLSHGQLDRYTDFARDFWFGLCTGATYFVDNQNLSAPFTGHSDHPFRFIPDGVAATSPTRGDIVMIRTGNFPGPLTINTRVTLRACRGTVRIGT